MRKSPHEYHQGKLVEGYDYQLQIWVANGVCLDIGMNRQRFQGKTWEDARIEHLGAATHQLCLMEELTALNLQDQLVYLQGGHPGDTP